MMIALLAAATAQPLPPHGKWLVEHADSMCVASRQFGSDDNGPSLGITTLPLSSMLTFVLTRHDGPSGNGLAKGIITVEPGGRRAEGMADAWRTKGGLNVVKVVVPQADLGDIAEAKAIGVALDGQPAIVVRPDNIAGAMKALDACRADLAQRWQLDPAEQAAIATPAKGINPGSFITNDDYPKESIRSGEKGMNIIVSTIGLDGRISDCRAVVSSGFAALDEASCRAMKLRGRYQPAIGKDGKPMISHDVRQVIWNVSETRSRLN